MFSRRSVLGSSLARRLLQAILLALPLLVPLASHGDEAVPPRKEHSFTRITRDEHGQPQSFDTAVTHYIAEQGPFAGATVDLVGAIHVGETSYYEQLNRLFTRYDGVLYELVAPEGTRIPKNSHLETKNQPIMELQSGVRSMLGLEHQLEQIDYTKPKFIHADMSPKEFAKSMKDRNESFLQLFFRILGRGMVVRPNTQSKYSDVDLLTAMFAPDRNIRLNV